MTNTIVFAIIGLVLLATLGYVLFRRWEPKGWYIGPRIRGTNYSKGMPLFPTKLNDGWAFKISKPTQEVDYITRSHKSLAGVHSIRMKANVLGSFFQSERPEGTPTVSLVLQHKNDDWSGAPYRWYLPHVIDLTKTGPHEVNIALSDPRWRSVTGGGTILSTIQNIGRIGLTFGGSGGLGHGVGSKSAARFELISFELLDKNNQPV